jgi:hypothetical protein
MGKMQRDKGARNERAIVNHWRALGVKCDRVPLSGAHGGEYAGDVDLYAYGPDEAPLIGEVKARGNGSGFKTITKWLGTNDYLVLHEDRAARLYVLPERVLERLILRK